MLTNWSVTNPSVPIVNKFNRMSTGTTPTPATPIRKPTLTVPRCTVFGPKGYSMLLVRRLSSPMPWLVASGGLTITFLI